MKKKLLTAMILMVVTLCGGCRSASAPDTTTPQDTQDNDAGTEQEENLPEGADGNTAADTTETEATEPAEDSGLMETVQFTVDITDDLIDENGMVIGNTSSDSQYSGIIEIYLDDALVEKAKSDIQVGHTYLFTAAPMMTMSIPPQITALEYQEASESDITALEEIRAQISNFEECMAAYETMSLEEIIQDANFNYALWTQDQIREYTEFLAQKGYEEGAAPQSYVKIREELNGIVPGGAMTGEE